MDNLINVAFGIDANYAAHMSVTIASILGHAKDARFRFIVLNTGIEGTLRSRIERAAPQSEFVWVDVGDVDVPAFETTQHFSRAVLFRLALDKLAPEDCRRVIFLDADLIVTDDIFKLWQVDLGPYPIAAVTDENSNPRTFAARWGLFETGSYFNAGVLLIDLARVRSDQIFARAFEFYRRHHHELEWNDQDALNYALWENWLKLDPAWNVQRSEATRLAFGHPSARKQMMPRIVHFTGGEKPWKPEAYHPWSWLYWRWAMQTTFFRDTAQANRMTALKRLRHYVRWLLRKPRPISEARPSTVEPMAEPSGEKIAVSLIISTKNRARRLERCLKSTSEIAFDGSWELIVVDNASTDETPKIIEEARKSIRAPVIKLFESARGLGAARNRGIAVARGGIIAFTDDDCYVDRHYLTQIVRAFDDERVGYVTGRVELYDPTDAEVTIRRSLKAERYRARQYIHTDKIIGANLAFRRSVLRQIGGFDVHMGAGRLFPAEDVDAVARAARMGWEGLYCPEILVHHHHGRKINDVPKLLKAYDIGRGAYTVKYLLRGQFIPFLKGVASVRWRMGPIQSWRLHTFSMLLWEGYGAAAYLIVRAKELFVGKMQSDSPRMGSVSTSKPCTEWVNPPSIGAD